MGEPGDEPNKKSKSSPGGWGVDEESLSSPFIDDLPFCNMTVVSPSSDKKRSRRDQSQQQHSSGQHLLALGGSSSSARGSPHSSGDSSNSSDCAVADGGPGGVRSLSLLPSVVESVDLSPMRRKVADALRASVPYRVRYRKQRQLSLNRATNAVRMTTLKACTTSPPNVHGDRALSPDTWADDEEESCMSGGEPFTPGKLATDGLTLSVRVGPASTPKENVVPFDVNETTPATP